MLVSLFLVLFIIYTIIGIYSIPKWQVKSCSKINQSFKVHMRSKCKTITRNENRSLEDVTYIRLILAINHSFLEFVSFALQQLVPEGCVYKYNDRSALFLIAGLKILFLKRADSSKWSKSKNWNSISSALEKRKEKKKKQVSRLNGEQSIGGRTIPEDRSSRRFSHEWDSLGNDRLRGP